MDLDRIAELERDLAEAIERQSATTQVLEVLGRSAFELEPVFETVLGQAVRLCQADAGLIYVLEGESYRVAVAHGASQAYRDYISSVPIQAVTKASSRPEMMVGAAAGRMTKMISSKRSKA